MNNVQTITETVQTITAGTGADRRIVDQAVRTFQAREAQILANVRELLVNNRVASDAQVAEYASAVGFDVPAQAPAAAGGTAEGVNTNEIKALLGEFVESLSGLLGRI